MNRPTIVILDAYTTNPGDLQWTELEALGVCTIYERTAPSEIVERAASAEILLTNKVVLDANTIAQLPHLKGICVLATGFNVVDGTAARSRGIPVCNVPEYSTPNVAQAVFALILELTNRTGHHVQTVREGRWTRSTDFCYWDYPLVELAGRTLGIVGYGRIGQSVAKIGRAFGMEILACRRNADHGSLPEGGRSADLESVFAQSDLISFHCPLTAQTRGMVNAARLNTMRPDAFLINTARGLLVVEADLADALNAGRIAGAGLDVLSVEPPTADNPLLSAKNCLITPHIAWATHAARARLLAQTIENVRACLAGRPINVVN